MIHSKKILLLLLFFTAISCKNKSNDSQTDLPFIVPIIEYEELKKDIVFRYAKGITIKGDYDKYVITIKNPWKSSEDHLIYELLSPNIAYTDYLPEHLENGFHTPKKVVVTSTTHIPHLELLGVENTLVGFPGTNYISSEKTRQLIDEGLVRELGKNEDINTEVLLELKPELVIGFGIDGRNKTLETIGKAGIPVIYNGDWLEDSPLAKAEWIKFFGVLFSKEEQADSIFNKIEHDYIVAKQLASEAKKRPTILSGAMHKDIWYLPNGASPEAQLLKDANTNYLWGDTTGSGSLALNFENVLVKAKEADLWLSPSYYTSLDALEKANPHYTNFDAFRNKQVYSFSMTTGDTGGVLYYELGIARPDLVLKDIVKICHPELLEGYEPYFFKRLQ